MHLIVRINVARPVNFHAQIMGLTPEAAHTTGILLEDAVLQVGVVGVNLLAAEVFCFSF